MKMFIQATTIIVDRKLEDLGVQQEPEYIPIVINISQIAYFRPCVTEDDNYEGTIIQLVDGTEIYITTDYDKLLK